MRVSGRSLSYRSAQIAAQAPAAGHDPCGGSGLTLKTKIESTRVAGSNSGFQLRS